MVESNMVGKDENLFDSVMIECMTTTNDKCLKTLKYLLESDMVSFSQKAFNNALLVTIQNPYHSFEALKVLIDSKNIKFDNATYQKALFLAIEKNNTKFVSLLLNHKKTPLFNIATLNQALLLAASNGSLEILNTLIKQHESITNFLLGIKITY